ncbi:phosphoesterase RecJ-like protein [Aquimarina sp. EL_43]|uniref:DHH family phosphoesterase n=1 Tax=unclassified Aquimarina TaxID=2627091 RepID=UPI0018C8FBEF|nr:MULTISPECIES: DHH family phosphoesterase [unclassified Aquimarina]MBG6128910.1 phosphoesterase RecJ-like protein [Aquimarina sp. EL_35]MBG6149974.1 phosphoesterase RecJ-like protein [Aquimarina sp. EL_32]MBG6167339.1 phosphoesterase RecJ-like protein [Aquimarina sp. EL_43]
MNTIEINKVRGLLSSSKNIVIVTHKNPDGDAIGSSLALYHYLISLGHNVTVITPNDYPLFLKWMPGENTILKYDNDTKIALSKIENADLIFTLDFNHFSRSGDMENVLAKTETSFIMIDHHQQPANYAKFTYSDPGMSSTCQMIYHFIEKLDDLDKITSEIATCIYVGIMTDTGSFRYRSTTSITHKVIADLIDRGADNTRIHENIYDTNTLSKIQLKGVALNNLRVLPEYKTAYITLSQKELDQHNFKKGDTEGFVNFGLSIKGIKFAAIFIENKGEEIIKISLRSKGDFSVNEFSRNHFEGGGHNNAAGGRSNLSLSNTVEKFISILPTYKKVLNQ